MNLLNRRIKLKILGSILISLSVLVIVPVLIFSVILILAGIKSGISALALIPLICISLFILFLSGFGIYLGIKYLKKKEFKKNISLGKVLIIIGLASLAYTLLKYVFSNLTGNSGGELQIVFAFILALTIVPLGMALKNGVTD